MALVAEQDKDKIQNPGETSGVAPLPSSGTSGSIAAAPGGGASPVSTKPGQSFASLNQYIKPNAAQAEQFAGNIVGGLNTEAEGAKSAVNTAGSNLSGQISSGIQQPDKALINKVVASPYSDTTKSYLDQLFKDTNSALALDKNPAEQSAIKQSAIMQANKTTGGKSSLSPADQAAWDAQKNLLYKGPNTPTATPEYQGAVNAVQNAQEKGALAQTEGGRKQLVEGQEKNKTAGVTGLNQALLSMVPGAAEKIQGTKSNFEALTPLLTNTGNQLTTQEAAAEKTQAGLFPTALASAGQGALSGVTSGITNDYLKGAYQQDQLNNQIANALYEGGKLTNDQVQAMGMTPAQWTTLRQWTNTIKQNWGQDFPFQNYANWGAPGQSSGYSAMDFATPEEYTYYQALSELLGQPAQLSPDNKAGQGKYPVTTFNYDKALKDAQDIYHNLVSTKGVTTQINPNQTTNF